MDFVSDSNYHLWYESLSLLPNTSQLFMIIVKVCLMCALGHSLNHHMVAIFSSPFRCLVYFLRSSPLLSEKVYESNSSVTKSSLEFIHITVNLLFYP